MPAGPTPQLPQDRPAYEQVDGGFVPLLPSSKSCLKPEERTQPRQLLYQFRDRFNDGRAPIPDTNLLTAHLDTANASAISVSPRRLSPAVRQVVRDGVADPDAKGITEPSTGCWSARIVMAHKASGAWCLCCEYRAISKHVRIPQPPLPRTGDIVASFNGKR
ncbi:hypothetical protein ACSSS7_007840 [Eimeria intestinalis]